jgi:hypothetical protein
MKIKKIEDDLLGSMKNLIFAQENYVVAKDLKGFPKIRLDDIYLSTMPISEDTLMHDLILLINEYKHTYNKYKNSNEESYSSVLQALSALNRFVDSAMKTSQGKYLFGDYDEGMDFWVFDAITQTPKKSIHKIQEAILPSLIIYIFEQFLLRNKKFNDTSVENHRSHLFTNFGAVFEDNKDDATYKRRYNEFLGLYHAEWKKGHMIHIYFAYQSDIEEFLKKFENNISKIMASKTRELFIEFISDYKREVTKFEQAMQEFHSN